MRRERPTSSMLLLAGIAACTCQRAPAPVLTAVEPATAQVDVFTALAIRGEHFRPRATVDFDSPGASPVDSSFGLWLVAGDARVPLTDVRLVSERELSAWYPALAAAPGTYDLELLDPGGHRALLPRAFTVTVSSCGASANGTPCDDGNACTMGETCQGGRCQGPTSVVTCTPGACTAHTACDRATGQCVEVVKGDGASCSDGNACTSISELHCRCLRAHRARRLRAAGPVPAPRCLQSRPAVLPVPGGAGWRGVHAGRYLRRRCRLPGGRLRLREHGAARLLHGDPYVGRHRDQWINRNCTSAFSTKNESSRSVVIGPLLADIEYKLIAKSGEEVGPGEKGVLYVKSEQVMEGYYKREEATQEVLKDGWLNTGDIAMITFNGELKIIGRSKETIVLLGGENMNQDRSNLNSQSQI